MQYMAPYFANSYRKGELEPFLRVMHKSQVVEIGYGCRPMVEDNVSCGNYVGVDPNACRQGNNIDLSYVNRDGLTFLRDKNERRRSGVIVSFGVFDVGLIGGRNAEKYQKRYLRELGNAIKEHANPFAIVVGNHVIEFMGEPDYINAKGHSGREGGVYVTDRARLGEIVGSEW